MWRELEAAGDGKGNSLFSEVEDRRQKVEWQLKVTNERYITMPQLLFSSSIRPADRIYQKCTSRFLGTVPYLPTCAVASFIGHS